jgi:hypothetical protein
LKVCDIEFDQPQANDVIFVDTNVLLFSAYAGTTTGLRSPEADKVNRYLRYLGRLKQLNSTLVLFPTTLIEMANVIERYEYVEACDVDGVQRYSRGNELKDYRRREDFRKTVSSAVGTSWSEVQNRTHFMNAELTNDICQQAAETAMNCAIGMMDAIHLGLMRANNIPCVLSDDIDFVDQEFDITLLTKNSTALSRAATLEILHRR